MLLGCMLGAAIGPRGNDGHLVTLLAFAWPFVLALAIAWLAYWRASRRRVHVDVLCGALRIDGMTVRPKGHLRRGAVTALDDGRARVDLLGRLVPRVRLEVRDIGAARELLGALGLDRRPGTSLFRVRTLRSYFNFLVLGVVFFAVPLAVVACSVSVTLGAIALACAVVAPMMNHALARRDLTVGSDGIDVVSPHRRAFVPHARIRRVDRVWPEGHEAGSRRRGEIVSWGFEMELDDGRVLRFDTRPARSPGDVWKTDPVFEAALQAWSTWKSEAAESPVHASALLARGERSTRAWIAALRELATDGAGGYRVAALDERALFAVLSDAGASRETRAAAAIALGAREDHAPRLRVAAEALADPVVRRVAVASAARAAEEELETELDEASFAPAPAARRAR